MKEGVAAIAAVEGPVNITILHQRLREAWGIGLIGSRTRDNIDAPPSNRPGWTATVTFVAVPGATVDALRGPNGGWARTVEQCTTMS